jgi:chitinase
MKHKVVYYHTSWSQYTQKFLVSDVPLDHVDEIAYAFFDARPGPDGKTLVCVTGDPWADFDRPFGGDAKYKGSLGQLQKYKDLGKTFDVTLAWGGWTWSKNCSDVTLTKASRAAFIDSVLKILDRTHDLFTGFAIDWEYLSDDGKNYGKPGNIARPEDGENFIAFLKEFRAALVGSGRKNFRLSMCTTAAPEKLQWPVEKIHPLIDEIQIMTYDFADGAWFSKAAHHANLRKSAHAPYSTEQAVDAYLARGVPASKLLIGAAFYSRGCANTDGLGKPCKGASPDKSWDEAGMLDYKACPPKGSVEMWDDEAKASYAYDSKRKVFTSYDCPKSIREKCAYVKEKGLLGILVWETSGDFPITHSRSLTKIMHDEFSVPGGAPPAPVKEAPVKAPVKEVPVKEAPVKEAPVPTSGRLLTPRERRVVDQLKSVEIERRLLAGETLEEIAKTRKSLQKYLDKTTRFYIA